LGEVHDNPDHHAFQAAAVAALAPKALVFEMLDPAQAARATPAARADADSLAAAFDWAGSGWPDFALYWPIFAAAPGAAIRGGALPGPEVRRAVTEGAAAVFGPEAARYGLTTPLPAAEQAAREADQFAAHCEAMPREMMAGMVEAQRLRDAALARAALAALAETGGPVTVIAGSGHTVAGGIPAALAAAAPVVAVLSLGQGEGTSPEPGYDLWRNAPAPERGDPCEGLRKDG
jgi:uncharacterized iron-regulated protein